MNKCNVVPGSKEWEEICLQCGLCCLVKYTDGYGKVWLTNIRCDMLNEENGKCKCYSADINARESGSDSCLKHGGSVLNMKTLFEAYVVPSSCPYVQLTHSGKKVKKTAPDISLKDTVPESSVKPEDVSKHIIAGTHTLFQYNPLVNEKLHKEARTRNR